MTIAIVLSAAFMIFVVCASIYEMVEVPWERNLLMLAVAAGISRLTYLVVT